MITKLNPEIINPILSDGSKLTMRTEFIIAKINENKL